MARVSIYVTDDLKAEMDEIEDVNWSEIVRPSIQSAIATSKHRRNKNMQTAIERLRASRQEQTAADKQKGIRHGRDWAENKASYRELRTVADLCEADDPEQARSLLRGVLDPDDVLEYDEFNNHYFGSNEADGEYVAGWITGAQQFYQEVADKL